MITETQRQRRKKYLGSSDAPQVCGVSLYGGPADVYAAKVLEVEKDENASMTVGTWTEGGIKAWFQNETGKRVHNKNLSRVADNGVLAANYDGFVDGEPAMVEVKTAGIVSPLTDEWREALDKNTLPPFVLVQVHHQFAVMPEMQRCYVPMLIGGVGFIYKVVDRDQQLVQSITDCEIDFWQNHVVKRVPPDDYRPKLEILKSVVREEGKTVQLDKALIEAWNMAKEDAKDAETRKDNAWAAILSVLGDAEIGQSEIGQIRYVVELAGMRLDADAIKTNEPSVWEKYAKQATRRVPRFKKAK